MERTAIKILLGLTFVLLIALFSLISPDQLHAEEANSAVINPSSDKNRDVIRRVVVVGVRNEAKEQELSTLLVVQGVAQLLTQELYDSGRFMPVEDNPEITKQIKELIAQSISSDGAQQQTGNSFNIFGCDAVVTACIKKFSKSRLRGFAGPFSASNVDIETEVEVTVTMKNGEPIIASGSGKGTTKSRGVLFEIRNDKIHFDKTSVGIAMQSAVKEAVQKIAARMTEERQVEAK